MKLVTKINQRLSSPTSLWNFSDRLTIKVGWIIQHNSMSTHQVPLSRIQTSSSPRGHYRATISRCWCVRCKWTILWHTAPKCTTFRSSLSRLQNEDREPAHSKILSMLSSITVIINSSRLDLVSQMHQCLWATSCTVDLVRMEATKLSLARHLYSKTMLNTKRPQTLASKPSSPITSWSPST